MGFDGCPLNFVRLSIAVLWFYEVLEWLPMVYILISFGVLLFSSYVAMRSVGFCMVPPCGFLWFPYGFLLIL